MRLIYADTVRRIIDSPRNKTQMLNMLEQTPTIEIIMCKNCNNAHYDTIFKEYWCDGKKVMPNHFCGYAERREDG